MLVPSQGATDSTECASKPSLQRTRYLVELRSAGKLLSLIVVEATDLLIAKMGKFAHGSVSSSLLRARNLKQSAGCRRTPFRVYGIRKLGDLDCHS